MNKNDLLRSIAEKGYDVGFGAKKHFATYDIIEKMPGLISFSSMAFGIIALVANDLSTKFISSAFIILGIVGLYISLNDHKKKDYDQAGTELTKILDELESLYFEVKCLDESEILISKKQALSEIKSRYYPVCISKQILFSNWYAHYKFFWEKQIGWIDEQLKFNFFRDKVPLSFWITIFISILLLVIFQLSLINYICNSLTS